MNRSSLNVSSVKFEQVTIVFLRLGKLWTTSLTQRNILDQTWDFWT